MRISRIAADLGEVRRLLEIDFAEFNQTLRELGTPFLPIADPEHHTQVLRHFVSVNRKRIVDSRRERFFEDFASGKPLHDYLALSRLDQFEVPEEWPETYESPPEEVMTELVNSWLGTCGAPPMESCTRKLGDLDALRRRNESFVGRVLPTLSNLVTAHR